MNEKERTERRDQNRGHFDRLIFSLRKASVRVEKNRDNGYEEKGRGEMKWDVNIIPNKNNKG